MALKILIGSLRIGIAARIIRSVLRWSPGTGPTQATVRTDRQEIVKKWAIRYHQDQEPALEEPK